MNCADEAQGWGFTTRKSAVRHAVVPSLQPWAGLGCVFSRITRHAIPLLEVT